MKLQTVTTQVQDIELEIPIFWKEPNKESYLGIINEGNCIKFSTNEKGDYKTISHLGYWLIGNETSTAHRTWESISEEAFLKAHDEFLQSLSLVPKFVIDDHDDLKGVIPMDEVTQEIENELNRIP